MRAGSDAALTHPFGQVRNSMSATLASGQNARRYIAPVPQR